MIKIKREVRLRQILSENRQGPAINYTIVDQCLDDGFRYSDIYAEAMRQEDRVTVPIVERKRKGYHRVIG
jgi:hypothetical protein